LICTTSSRRIPIDAVIHAVYVDSVAEAICESAAEQRADHAHVSITVGSLQALALGRMGVSRWIAAST